MEGCERSTDAMCTLYKVFPEAHHKSCSRAWKGELAFGGFQKLH